MVKTKELINEFLIAYINNDLEQHRSILHQDIQLDYSNLGIMKGKSSVLDKLSWHQNFDIKRVTTTNYLSYEEAEYEYVGLIAHHLVAYEKNNELYPLVFGGKYVFKIDLATQLIKNISFVLEYQGENTIFVKDYWILASKNHSYNSFKDFNLFELLNQMECLPDKNKYSQLSKLFFWCLDTKDLEILYRVITPDFTISRDKSVGHDKFKANAETLDSFITLINDYFDLDQSSVRITEVIEENDFYIIQAQRLTPHRLGTKKLNSITKYHSFFDEDITLWINKKTSKIRSINMSKAADVFYQGFPILEF